MDTTSVENEETLSTQQSERISQKSEQETQPQNNPKGVIPFL